MSLRLMKERMKQSGMTFREEEIKDAVLIEEVENENDVSYCPTFYKVISHNNYDDEKNYEKIHARLYGRKWSSYDVHTMNMKTLIKEPVMYGDLFYNQKDNTYWICMQTDCIDDINYISKLVQCNYHMYWQKNDGTIISRYVFVQNASSYNNGEIGNSVITLQSNQFMVYIPFDDEIDELDNGKRISITKSLRRCKPYELTRPDDISYNYGDNGILNIIFTQTQVNTNEDKLVELSNGKEVWICNYTEVSNPSTPTPPKPSNPDETADLSAKISGNTNLRIGVTRTYTVTLSDKEGNAVQWNDTKYSWNVISDFDVRQTVTENKISLTVEDEDFIDSSFLLQVIKLNDSSVLSEIEITVIDVM